MLFTNEGFWDRIIRIVAALVLGYVAWATWPATIGIVALIIGAIAFATGLVGWCPGYVLFGITTTKKAGA